WSGMNWFAHNAASGSPDEAAFLASQLDWLFAADSGAGPQVSITPSWNGDDRATLALQATSGPSLVLFKESLFPGWSARLATPTGSQPVALAGSEMDFMLAALPAVPAGSSLVFVYGPTVFEQASWVLSLLFLVLVVVWVVRPALLVRGRRWVAGRTTRVAGSLLRPIAK